MFSAAAGLALARSARGTFSGAACHQRSLATLALQWCSGPDGHQPPPAGVASGVELEGAGLKVASSISGVLALQRLTDLLELALRRPSASVASGVDRGGRRLGVLLPEKWLPATAGGCLAQNFKYAVQRPRASTWRAPDSKRRACRAQAPPAPPAPSGSRHSTVQHRKKTSLSKQLVHEHGRTLTAGSVS